MNSVKLQNTIDMKIAVTFLYTNNKFSKNKIKKLIPFVIATNTIKYLGINLMKEMKDIYSENCKTLMKEINEHTNKWKNIPCSWISKINTVTMSALPKPI